MQDGLRRPSLLQPDNGHFSFGVVVEVLVVLVVVLLVVVDGVEDEESFDSVFGAGGLSLFFEPDDE